MDVGRRISKRPERYSPISSSTSAEAVNRRKALKTKSKSATIPCRVISSTNAGNDSTLSSIDVTDVLTDGSLFRCDRCGSNVYNSRLRGCSNKKARTRVVQPNVRYTSNRERLNLCVLCSQKHDAAKTIRNTTEDEQAVADASAKVLQKVQNDKELLKKRLIEVTKVKEVSTLICDSRMKPTCNCSAALFTDSSNIKEHVSLLLTIQSEAAQLKAQKSCSPSTNGGKIGLGNGKKRSQQYEKYVLMKRELLRDKLMLCESFTQKMLGYSNNFLHKRLLTEHNRTRLKGSTKELIPVTMLWKKKCCRDQCISMSRTHINLLVKWRQLAESGQRGLQQAVAELLTPTAGAKTNCYKFISLVTGSSPATIAKISKMVKKNGGVLGLQEHGLRKYWRNKRGLDEEDCQYEELATVWSSPRHRADEVELIQTIEKQDDKIKQLQEQLEKQKTELNKQKKQLATLQHQQTTRQTDNLQYPLQQTTSWPSNARQSESRPPIIQPSRFSASASTALATLSGSFTQTFNSMHYQQNAVRREPHTDYLIDTVPPNINLVQRTPAAANTFHQSAASHIGHWGSTVLPNHVWSHNTQFF